MEKIEKRRLLAFKISIILVGTILYYVLGKLSFSLSVTNTIVTNAPFFPEGIGMAFTIFFGYYAAFGVLFGQFILAISSGIDFIPSLLLSPVNASLAVLGAYLFNKLKINQSFEKVKDAIKFALIVLIILQPISALLGNIILKKFNSDNFDLFLNSALYWWLGNTIGQLTFVPFLLFFLTKKYQLKEFFRTDLIYAIISGILTFVIFSSSLLIDTRYTYVPLLFLFPYCFYLASYQHSRTLVLSIFTITITSFLALVINISNINTDLVFSHFMRLDLFIISLQISGLTLSILITNNKKNEESLRKSEANLKLLNNTKDKFFSIIAHDLKNPIGAFRDLLLTLSSDYDLFEESDRKDMINILNKSSENLYNMMWNLLEWANSQQGKINFYPQPYFLKDLVNHLFELLKLLADNKNITLVNKIDDKLSIYADVNLINTVLRNLITNSIKFTNRNGEISISALKLNGEIVVTVKDNGIGMNQDTLSKLFRIETQNSKNGTSNEKGTGLGLILCYEFIKLHKGEIWADSIEGIGSNFYFKLPNQN